MNGLAERQDGLARKLVSSLIIGRSYTLDDMAALLGVQLEAIKRKGVLTRANSDAQILLMMLEKDKYSTPEYVDHIDGCTLFWSGQNRIKSTENNLLKGTHDTFIFIQQRRHTPYIYYGRAVPIRMNISMVVDVPSHIIFDLPEYAELMEGRSNSISDGRAEYVSDVVVQYGNNTPHLTEKEVIAKIRTAQSAYRSNVLTFWDNQCAVTGVDDITWLVASHIKPWREATNDERVDPKNSLLLTPNYDKLFDRGVISFSPTDGKIILPEQLSMRMWSNLNKLNINEDTHLRKVPDGVGEYLEYHKRYVYNFEPTGRLTTEEFLEDIVVKGLA